MTAGPGYTDPETGIYLYGEDDLVGDEFSELLNVGQRATAEVVTSLEKGRLLGSYDAPWVGGGFRFRFRSSDLFSWRIPNPGVPYRIAIEAACEMGTESGSTAARWDLHIGIRPAGGATQIIGVNPNSTAEFIYQDYTSVPLPQVLAGEWDVVVRAYRVYPAADTDGLWGEITGVNRLLRIAVYAA